MKTIEVPLLQQDLQKRFESWLKKRGNLITRKKETIIIYVSNEQDAFWIGCNYVALENKLFDGPLTKTLG
jgi:putative methionine-R-sulfoxide reductase with GAF domain